MKTDKIFAKAKHSAIVKNLKLQHFTDIISYFP